MTKRICARADSVRVRVDRCERDPCQCRLRAFRQKTRKGLSRANSDNPETVRDYLVEQDQAFQAKMAAAILEGRESAPIGIDTTHYGREPVFIQHGEGEPVPTYDPFI